MMRTSATKIGKKLCFGLLAVSLATTSLGMGVTSTAYAASPTTENTTQVNNTKGSTYGLIALGLLALFSGHGHSSDTAQTNGTPAAATGSASVPSTATSGSTTTTSPSSSTGSSHNIAADEQQAVALMNADRRAQGLPDLKVDSRLTYLGEKYAQDMINRNFFSHTNPEGQSPFDRMKQAGISYSYAGENIAINQSVPAAETAFMNSSGHRANILNSNYTNVGIGVAYDKSGDVYVVQEFIKP